VAEAGVDRVAPSGGEYGERSGVVEDIGGHRWELTQTVRDVPPEEWVGRQSLPGEKLGRLVRRGVVTDVA
jgi:hypothetical protein